MVDARLAVCWAIGEWLVTYAGWRDRELRRLGFHINGIPFAAKRWFPAEWLTDAFRQQVSRGLRRLEREGVLVRVTGEAAAQRTFGRRCLDAVGLATATPRRQPQFARVSRRSGAGDSAELANGWVARCYAPLASAAWDESVPLN